MMMVSYIKRATACDDADLYSKMKEKKKEDNKVESWIETGR